MKGKYPDLFQSIMPSPPDFSSEELIRLALCPVDVPTGPCFHIRQESQLDDAKGERSSRMWKVYVIH